MATLINRSLFVFSPRKARASTLGHGARGTKTGRTFYVAVIYVALYGVHGIPFGFPSPLIGVVIVRVRRCCILYGNEGATSVHLTGSPPIYK